MFEKEAEKYVIKKHHIDKTKLPIDFSLRCEFSDDFTDFQKGAEFGYNKAFVEADKNLKAILTDFKKAGYQKRQEIKEMTKEECEIETSKAIMEMRSRIAELEEEKAELEEENEELEKEKAELKKLNASLVNKR